MQNLYKQNHGILENDTNNLFQISKNIYLFINKLKTIKNAM